MIATILRAYVLMALYYLDLYTEEDKAIVKQRQKACKHCPIRSGNWCSKKKRVGHQRGCGCFLPAKYHDRSEPQHQLCPLRKWLPFGI